MAAIKAAYQAQLLKRVDVHDLRFSFECLSEPIPVTGHKWRPIRTPIPLAEWRTSVQPRNVFTTVMNWTYKPLSYGGQTYGQKDAEFVKFLELPGRVVPAVLGCSAEVPPRAMDDRLYGLATYHQ